MTVVAEENSGYVGDVVGVAEEEGGEFVGMEKGSLRLERNVGDGMAPRRKKGMQKRRR